MASTLSDIPKSVLQQLQQTKEDFWNSHAHLTEYQRQELWSMAAASPSNNASTMEDGDASSVSAPVVGRSFLEGPMRTPYGEWQDTISPGKPPASRMSVPGLANILPEFVYSPQLVPTIRKQEEPETHGGLTFITGASPADFKTKKNMTSVRKAAMETFLKGGNEKFRPLSLDSPRSQVVPTTVSATYKESIDSYFKHQESSLATPSIAMAVPRALEEKTPPPLPPPRHIQDSVTRNRDPTNAAGLTAHSLYNTPLATPYQIRYLHSSGYDRDVELNKVPQSRVLQQLDGTNVPWSAPTSSDYVNFGLELIGGQPHLNQTHRAWHAPASSDYVNFGLELIATQTDDTTLETARLFPRLESLPSLNDPAERRRMQNRIAQRNYRKKLRQRLEALEQRAEMESKNASSTLVDAMEHSIDPEVLAYQGPGDSMTVLCVCGETDDRRFIIPCVTCGTWQHIRCYYGLAQDVVEGHECIRCSGGEMVNFSRGPLKRTRDQDWGRETDTSGTQSEKRPKTVGAGSSVNIKVESTSHLDDMSSLYSVPETKPVQGLSHVTLPTTSPASNRSEHQLALETQGKIKVEVPQEPMQPKSKRKMTKEEVNEYRETRKRGPCPKCRRPRGNCEEHVGTHQGAEIDDGPTSDHIDRKFGTLTDGLKGEGFTPGITPAEVSTKAVMLEDTIEYIELLHQQIAEKDKLLEDNTLKIEQLQDQMRGVTRYWRVEHLGQARLRFTRTGAFQKQELRLTNAAAGQVIPGLPTHTENKRLGESTATPISRVLTSVPAVVPASDVFGDCYSPENATNRHREMEDQDGDDEPEARILTHASHLLQSDWTKVQNLLPELWKWDVEYQACCWTCTPLEPRTPAHYPLKIAGSPVVLPVEYQWPPMAGMNPPPDPRPSAPIDCRAALPLDVVRDMFLTFEGSIGFYVLISGLLQIVVPDKFDTTWAASHLPHKYGGLKVCYIAQNLEQTMLPPSATETSHSKPVLSSQSSGLSSIFKQSRSSSGSSGPALKLNDFIEARPKGSHRKERYAARIGLKVAKAGEPYLVMSTHVITEAILAKSHRTVFFPRSRGRFDKLDDDWNEHVDIWAHNERIGTIEESFDEEAEIYPNGFRHDVTLIKPTTPASVKDMASPISDLGWLDQDSWNSLRQQISAVKLLGPTEMHRSAKSVKCSRPSEIMVVGEGIFLNQTAAAGNSKSLKDHDMSTWRSLVSRALLYRVYPDFDPPNGYSGTALYAKGTRQDGTTGPGIVGFQSFVQRSGHVQSFNMEGPALDRRLQLGRVAFYGAFQVPEGLKREYTIV